MFFSETQNHRSTTDIRDLKKKKIIPVKLYYYYLGQILHTHTNLVGQGILSYPLILDKSLNLYWDFKYFKRKLFNAQLIYRYVLIEQEAQCLEAFGPVVLLSMHRARRFTGCTSKTLVLLAGPACHGMQFIDGYLQ